MLLRPNPYVGLLVVALLIVGNVIIWNTISHPKETFLSVSFLDVGQGDAILIETPSGVQMLIDGGKDRSAVRELPRVIGPFDRTIDIVVATHPDADHIGGLPAVFSRYDVSYFLESGKDTETAVFDHLEASVEGEQGVEHLVLQSGFRLHLGAGIYADVLHPEENVEQLRETNDASVILRLVYNENEFLFTGDAPTWVEERVQARFAVQSDVLQAGHHGSNTSTSKTWLDAVSPAYVVISAGKDNTYGHPHEEVLARIVETGAHIRSTIDHGTVTFRSDGDQIWELP